MSPPVPEVPGYDSLEEIGRGGFSVVYRARQVAVHREVALKVLRRIDRDDVALARFEQECRAMGALSWHPHIVVVYDAGTTADGNPYLAMELLPGGSLADRVGRAGPSSPAAVTTLGIELAGALQAAHDIGVLHRDIKPENVLLDRFDRAKLADFGIASAIGVQRTATGLLSGTLAHLAPELLDGKRASVSSDVYALGSTLYAVAAGRPAFSQPTDQNQVAVIRRVMDEPVPDLRPAGVPDRLASILERSMAKRPEDRYPSAAALEQDLRALASAAAPAPPPPPQPPGPSAAPAPAPPPARPATASPLASPPTAIVARSGRPAVPPRPAPPPPAAPMPPAPPSSPPNRRPVVIATAAVLAVLVVAALVAFLGGGSDDDAKATSATTTTTRRASTTTTTSPPTTAVDPARTTSPPSIAGREAGVTHTIAVPPNADSVVYGYGAVWVTSDDDGTVSRIDPATRTVTATIRVGASPGALTVGGGSIWVANSPRDRDGSVSRIDPNSDQVTGTIKVGVEPFGITYGGGYVWVAINNESTITKIDPATSRVVESIPFAPRTAPVGVTYAFGALWMADYDLNSVAKIDPETGKGQGRIAVGAGPTAIAAGEGSVWVTNEGDNSVSRIDPDRGVVQRTIAVGRQPAGIAVGAGAAWVTNEDDNSVSRILPSSSRVVQTIRVGVYPFGIATAGSSVWVANYGNDTVTRIGTWS